MSSDNIILSVRGLQKVYQSGRNRVHVLKGIDFDVTEGQIVALIGPSGVGKSTLLNIVGTLDRPTQGNLRIADTDVLEFDEPGLARFRNETIGFVFQFHHLLPEFTAIENVMMPGLIAGRSKAQLWQRAHGLLKEVGLEHRIEHRPGELSGGEMQRVAVARALMNNPRIVFADEPSGNLDISASKALHDLLWNLSRKHNRTFIIVTHNNELAREADKVLDIFDGRIKNEHMNQVI